MTGLTIVVTTADPERCRAALSLATAQAALGGGVRVYFHETAVTLLAGDVPTGPVPPELATLGQLFGMAREGGVTMIACQTGLALAGLRHDALVPGTEAGGMMSVLATLDEHRLVTI